MLRGIAKESIGVIGGSFAGLAAAIGLLRKGYDVTVLEQSSLPHKDRGAGIGLPPAMVEKCISLYLLDKNTPRLPISKRSFYVKDSSPSQSRQLWEQPFLMVPLNWGGIYSNLRERFPELQYLTGVEVTDVHQDGKRCYVETADASLLEFGRVIGADGIRSVVRNGLFPKIKPDYADYIVWRGIVDDEDIVDDPLFREQGAMYLFSNGHLILYRIPAPDYATSGRTLLNWAMYEHHTDISASELLTDKYGRERTISVPQDAMSHSQIERLHQFAERVLPPAIANIIRQTKRPFIQAIFDYQAPSYVEGRVCLLGDAATVLRPHTASGAFRALDGAISLVEAMDPNHSDIDASLRAWSDSQVAIAKTQSEMAKLMGRALVTEPPDWKKMDPATMASWWQDLMKGKLWYATEPKPFTPMKDSIDQLSRGLSRVTLNEESTDLTSKTGAGCRK